MRCITTMSIGLLAGIAAFGCQKKDAAPEAKSQDEAVAKTPESEASTDKGSEEAPAESSPAESLKEPEASSSADKSEGMFTVKLDTTKGEIVIEVHPTWAPLGATRFRELVEAGYYTDTAFFRVMEGFMAQTGISGAPKLSKKWGQKPIKDEPARKHNLRGMVTFAMAGENSRTTQFFINLVDNTQLDAMGFAPFGQVRDMTAVDALHSGYGDGPPAGKGPNQQKIKTQGNKYLKKSFPDLDYIKTATIVEE